MAELASRECTPCKEGGEPMAEDEIDEMRQDVPAWDVVEREGEKRLERTFDFADFQQALDFTYDVGEIAEEQGHHPVLTTEWGAVTVVWWTHKIGGLHDNDFIMAAKTDEIYKEYEGAD